MSSKKVLFALLVVFVMILSGISVIDYKYSNTSNSVTGQKSSIQPSTGDTLPSYVTGFSNMQSSLIRSLYSGVIPSSSSSSQSPGTIQSYLALSGTVGQTGFTQNTIDVNSNTIHRGTYRGENYVGQYGVAYDPTNGNIYVSTSGTGNVIQSEVSNYSSNAIIIINSTTMKITGNITETGYMGGPMVYDSFNSYLYAVSTATARLYVINAVDNTVVSNISLYYDAYGLVVDPLNGTVYAASSSPEIDVIQGTTMVGGISTSAYGIPYGITFDVSNGLLYASVPGYEASGIYPSASQSGAVISVNPSDPSSLNLVETGYGIASLTYYSGTVYGAQLLGYNITEMQGAKVTGNISLDYGMTSINANPVTGNIYVSYDGNQTLWKHLIDNDLELKSNAEPFMNSTPAMILSGGLIVISSSTGKSMYSETSLTGPSYMAFNPSTGASYSGYSLPGKVTKMSTGFKTTVTNTFTTPTDSYYDPSNGYLYVTNGFSGTVNVYNALTESLVTTLNMGGMPFRIAHTPNGQSVYITNLLNNSVVELSGSHVVNSFKVGYFNVSFNQTNGYSVRGYIPTGIAYDSSDGSLYVSLANVSISPYNAVEYGSYVDVLNIAKNTQTLVGLSANTPLGVAYNPSNNLVYVASYGTASAGVDPINVISGTSRDSSVTSELNRSLTNVSSNEYSQVVDLAYNSNTSSVFLVYQPTTSVGSEPLGGYSIGEIFGNNTLISSPITGLPTTVSSVAFSADGINYDPYTGGMIISVSSYIYTTISPDHVFTGAVLFTNGLTVTGYAITGLGSTSAQAINKYDMYVTNSIAGTVSYVSSNTNSTGNLTIDVSPANANVYLDGSYLSTTNGQVSVPLPGGYYFVGATLVGYSSYSNYVEVIPGQNTTVNVKLSPISNYGYLTGTVSPNDAVILANGITIPVSSGTFNQSLVPGTYLVSAYAQGYSNYQTFVSVTAGKETTLSISLNQTAETYEVSGVISPYNASMSPSVVFNGTVAYLNATGYFQVYLKSGTYHISASEVGYFPISRNITVSSNAAMVISMKKEPNATSTESSNSTIIHGFNATISNIKANYSLGYIGVTFSASSHSTLTITVPFTNLSSSFRNLTLTEILNSKVYIGNTQYKDFSITVSSNYSVTLTVFNYTGDPSLYWVFTPYSHFTNQKANAPLSPYLLYAVISVIAIVIVASAALIATRRRRR